MQVLANKQLANGQEITFYDNSRRVAGDRWQVRMEAQLALPLERAALEREVGGNPELIDYIFQELEGRLLFVVRRERNFVAAEEKEPALVELQGQLYENLADYLANPNFPGKLLARRCEELSEAYRHARQRPSAEEEEEESGPADFSACFRD